jgi:hypothetical protein
VIRFALAAALLARVVGIACAQSPHERLRPLADESYSRTSTSFREETLAIGPVRAGRLEDTRRHEHARTTSASRRSTAIPRDGLDTAIASRAP